jgi:hypothetical protein
VILNVWTVLAIFLEALGALLAIAWLAVCVRAWRAEKRAVIPEDRDDRLHLAGLVASVLLLVQLIDWPLFYALLASYVPALSQSGAMCAYGVARVDHARVVALEWLEPLVLLALGFHALLGAIDRRGGGGAFARVRIAAGIPVALLALAQCALELDYLFRDKLGTPVTCCSQGSGAAGASIDWDALPWSARASPIVAWCLFFGLNLLVIALCTWRAKLRAPRRTTSISIALATLGLVNLAVTYDAWAGVLAPRVLGLPYHHCVYELLTNTLALGPAAICAVAGNACLLWPVALAPWRSRAPQAIENVANAVYVGCAVALATEILIVAVHAL